MPKSLTSRSTEHLRKQGYTVDVVESYNFFTKRRHDLWGCIDILAIGNGETLAVQVTSKSNMSARIRKIEDSEALPEMLRSGWRVIVHGWWRGTNGRYQLKETEF
jgi:predicted RecB family endonuclease